MSVPVAAPFSRIGVLALLIVGFGAFLSMLYFIGVSDTGLDDGNNGRAHAAAKGLTGYSALADLVEADGFEVDLSREASELETVDLLVLTPPHNADPEELARLLYKRRELGPTLIILPKWTALPANRVPGLEQPDQAKDGWVLLGDMRQPRWTGTEYVPFAFELEESEAGPPSPEGQKRRSFATSGPIAGITGELPGDLGWYATKGSSHAPLVVNQDGRPIALSYTDPTSQLQDANPNWAIFVVEPDLLNNWGLADEARALTALSIVRFMAANDTDRIVFDLTFNGFGATLNLLTFAFQPPFLAATLCLLLAVVILAWRAFYRFGPSIAPPRETVFGKTQLVTNGADLIVRANRVALLAKPYAALSARRMAGRLGLANPRPDAIDASLAALDPGARSFSQRAEDLTTARKPDAIVSAARALYRQSSRETRGTQGNPKK